MSAPAADLLDRDAFTAWLRSLEPDTVLQERGCVRECALCAFERFLAHSTGREGWDADPTGFVNATGGEGFWWPAWVTDFYGVCFGSAEGALLTAARALAILEELR